MNQYCNRLDNNLKKEIMRIEKRNAARSEIWSDVYAQVKINEQLITGKVKNLGSKGMFLVTDYQLPVSSKINVMLLFKLKSRPDLHLEVNGNVAWHNKEGMGIQFHRMDLDKFRECVLAMVNDD